jgi:3-hydroxybutyryl-CoA dehydrogenase
MKLVVSPGDDLMKELLFHGMTEGTEIITVNDANAFPEYPDADCFIDLGFAEGNEIKYPDNRPVIINYVAGTLDGTGKNIVRINGWKSFLKRKTVEGACENAEMRETVANIFLSLNRTMSWTHDVPGFTSARIVAMIINEAYFALEENVSDKNAIDTAMKLGTNYPYGPFEWAEIIGIKNIRELLMKLSIEQPRYVPASFIQNEIQG